jgi:hypothetical protein
MYKSRIRFALPDNWASFWPMEDAKRLRTRADLGDHLSRRIANDSERV